jgi:hypothetical protein
MFYKKNWLSWSYDGVEFGPKTGPQSKFEFHIKKTIDRPLKSHKQELLENTRFLRDQFSEPFDLMFSGGLDSEIILRCYTELKIPINVFVFRYKNDYNTRDVCHALRICQELSVTPTVIDFDLEKFFENDALDIWNQMHVTKAGRLPHMKMIEYLDNIPVMGCEPPCWKFVNNSWQFELDEIEFGQLIYCKTTQRTAIIDWYGHSPEITLSHALLPRIQSMIKSGTNVNYEFLKHVLYKDIWPEIAVRTKRRGYEKFHTQPNAISPDLTGLLEFQKYIDSQLVSNHVCYLSETQLFDALCVQPSMPGYPATTH